MTAFAAVLAHTLPPALPPDPLVSDRPDFTESTGTIAAGRVQIEGGLTAAWGDHARTIAGPELLVRLGLGDRLELRLAPPGLAHDGDDTGWTDANVGFKLRLSTDGPRGLAWSMIGQLAIPSGDATFGAESPEPEIKVLWSFDLNDRVSLAGNVNCAARSDTDGGLFVEPSVSLSLGVAISDRLGVFAEGFAFYPIGGGEAAAWYLNAGATYALTPDLQLDARIGTGLGGPADELFAGLGIAVRY
ncbi:MAG: hypothetical protein HBSAPP03_24590 [Phycisphaerae bacterium]|nr:MAG: hypothetical protein HBSAPP03_24590 [Phycisphaerae bacterium]